MCRFALYLGQPISLSSLVTEPEHSIIQQSLGSREQEDTFNGDGFGVAWYAPEISPEPALFTDITPAWSNPNLRHLARVVQSPCILAHVRAASPGLPVVRLNCHPFVHGRFAFMHNGRIGGFLRIRRQIQSRLSDESFDLIAGSTDSEHLFALFIDHYRRSSERADPTERMAAALVGAIAEVEQIRRDAGVEESSRLNLAVADGRCAVVTRWASAGEANSLYLHTGKRYVCAGGVCHMEEPDTGRGAVIVVSEQLSSDAGWEAVPPGGLVLVRADLSAEVRAFSV